MPCYLLSLSLSVGEQAAGWKQGIISGGDACEGAMPWAVGSFPPSHCPAKQLTRPESWGEHRAEKMQFIFRSFLTLSAQGTLEEGTSWLWVWIQASCQFSQWLSWVAFCCGCPRVNLSHKRYYLSLELIIGPNYLCFSWNSVSGVYQMHVLGLSHQLGCGEQQ